MRFCMRSFATCAAKLQNSPRYSERMPSSRTTLNTVPAMNDIKKRCCSRVFVGGTRHAYDVVDYPRRGIRSYKYDGKRDNVETTKLGAGK